MNQKDFFHSNFERVADDFYPTIDERVIDGLLAKKEINGLIVDPCSPNGSGIVDALNKRGKNAIGLPDAFADFAVADWVVTNPPFIRGLVDRIIYRQIERIQKGEILGAAFLLRSIFDFAKGRAPMFESNFYEGQIKLRFRVWWSDARDQEPKHNFVWHIWSASSLGFPYVKYYSAPYDPQYAVQKGASK
jgi:hypothetical protein